jgi:hypothetical protein
MATNREYLQSIMSVLALAQNVDDDVLNTPGVKEMLIDMDNIADELKQAIE